QSKLGGMPHAPVSALLARYSKRLLQNSCFLITDNFLQSVIQLFSVILIPLRNFDDDIGGAVRHRLAAQTRLRSDAGSLVEFVKLRVGGFIARFQTFFHHHVAGRARTHAAASVVQPHLEALGNIQDAARQAVVAVGKFLGIDFHRLAARQTCHLEFLGGLLVFHFFDIRIATAHKFLPKPQPAFCPRAPTARLSSSAVRPSVPWPGSIHRSFAESVCSRCLSRLAATPRSKLQLLRVQGMKALPRWDYSAPWPSRPVSIPLPCAIRSPGAPQNPVPRIRWTLPACAR